MMRCTSELHSCCCECTSQWAAVCSGPSGVGWCDAPGDVMIGSCDCHVTCWCRDKERRYEERMKEAERSFQVEMEGMRESTKGTMLRLEADNARLRSEEERMRDEIKHERNVSAPPVGQCRCGCGTVWDSVGVGEGECGTVWVWVRVGVGQCGCG